MPHLRSILLASACVLLLASLGRADYQLDLTANDLTNGQSSFGGMLNVNPGDLVQFTLSLSGLGQTESVDYLAADLSVSDATFTTPTTPLPGAIIPDATNFVASRNSISAFYDDGLFTNSAAITTNGTFLTFSTTIAAGATGSDTISVTSAGSISADGTSSSLSTALPSLQLNISAVPEPSSCLLALLGGSALLARFGRRIARR